MPNRDPRTVRRARRLRSDPTPAEHALWRELRAQPDMHWRRQAPIGAAIADFACLRAKLIVEVDGGAHDHAAAERCDLERTGQLEALGFMVRRIRNEEVLHDAKRVAEELRAFARARLEAASREKPSLDRSASPPPPAPPPTASEEGRKPSRRRQYDFREHETAEIDPATLVLVGAISGAFGVKGEVRVRSFTTAPEGVVAYGPLYDADGRVVLTPKHWRAINDGLAVTGPEIPDRTTAEKLKSTPLHVPRHLLPPTEEDEFYHVDLIGCRVETLAGEPVGEVIDVHNFGADDLLEMRKADGKSHFLSFTKEAVPHVDLVGRRVVISPIEDSAGEPDDEPEAE